MNGKQRKDGWSDAEKQYLRDHFDELTNEQLSVALNKTISAIQAMASKTMGLKRSPAALSKRLTETWKHREGKWTEAEKQYLIDNWQTQSAPEIAIALGKTRSAVKSMGVKEMGLKKTKVSIRAINKRVLNPFTFKKGHLPINTIFGDEQVIRLRKNKRGPAYYWIRIGFKQWKQYHLYLWEQEHGPVPADHIIVFSNRNQLDCRLENLEMITPKANALRNSGSLNLPDGFVAFTLSPRDKELKNELLNYPELLELKRTQLQLNRAIRHETTGS